MPLSSLVVFPRCSNLSYSSVGESKLSGSLQFYNVYFLSSLHASQVDHQAGAYPRFSSMKRLGVYFYAPLDGMLVHRRVIPPRIKFSGTHLYTWVKRSTVRVKCLAQEHNTMSPARARTWTARSGVERTNHEATVPSTYSIKAGHKLLRTE